MANKELSEIRQDPVSHDWVIIATGRSRRPEDFKYKSKRTEEDNPQKCVFCKKDAFEDPAKSGNVVVATVFSKNNQEEWQIKVIENKYPLLKGDKCGLVINHGPYEVQPGAGHHEVVITRDHFRSLGQMSQEEIEKVVAIYQERYQFLSKFDCSRYILIFHNHGREAGASIAHPHSQIIAVPVMPGDAARSLIGSKNHYREKGECIHCAMIDWERKEKKRVIFENEQMILFAPYVPRTAFELRIYPKKHSAYFEKMDDSQKKDLAETLRQGLGRLYSALDDISYNFFIHTSPVYKNREHADYYHWHVEILPRASTPPAGFELGTDIDVSAVDPNEVAEYLRDVSLPEEN